MISFREITEECIQSFAKALENSPERNFILDYLHDLCEEGDEDFSVAVCLSHGALYTRRAFRGLYEFTLPYPCLDSFCFESALSALEEYAKREELPLVLCDLTEDDLELLTERYTHPSIDAVCPDEDVPLYRLEAVTEAMTLEQIPTLVGDTVTLTAPNASDTERYGALCRDEETIALWGYDFREDMPHATDADLFCECMREFQGGRTIPFFIYASDRFVGEVVTYGFDGRGGAEFAVRILPEYRRRGYAKAALSLLFDFAFHTLGMSYLDGRCLTKNTASRSLLLGSMSLRSTDGDTLLWRITRDAR